MTDTRFDTILGRGVAEIITEVDLVGLLDSGRILNLKQGFDPSAPDIHLGHVVGLRKLRQFQELGHKVTLIVGDWTARIGDPSGQSATRPMLSPDEIRTNARTYMEQFFKVVDKNKTELRWQSEWFSNFSLDEVIRLTSRFTIAQLLAREDFNKRYNSRTPISLAEMLYPLLQGYDSVAIKADVEFGGIDQKFNCLVGRELQQNVGQLPQQVFLVPLLIGTDGKQKMSKSLHNHIGIAEPPEDIYGKVMRISPDSLIMDYFELVTDVADEEIAEFEKRLETRSINPMNLKKRLAHEIVMQFHGKQAADQAQEYFERRFQKRELHKIETRATIRIKASVEVVLRRDMPKWLVNKKFAKSMSEARRLLSQGAVQIIRTDGTRQVVKDDNVEIKPGDRIKVGKFQLAEAEIVDADNERT
jgi:tyrosyl-tRNA synthetase